MLNAFLTFITEHQLFTPASRLLLTVSGGIDSVVLTELCRQAGFTFGIAHCNFQLRGDDSEADEAFVRALAHRCGAECYVRRFDAKTFAKNEGISTQMAARELRYPWFEELRQVHRYDYILTAHQQDDLLETILMNITRGTGLAGLYGILPKNGFIVRPLLFATRTEISTFLTQRRLTWREDSSNASVDYVRNRLRHDVIPTLRTINPNISAAAARLSERVKASETLLSAYTKGLEAEILQTDGATHRLFIAALEKQAAPLELLARWLSDFGFHYHQIKKIWTARNGQTGQRFFSSTHILTLDRGGWLVHPVQKPTEISYTLEEKDREIVYSEGCLQWVEVEKLSSEKNPNVAYLDADALAFPLTLRLWQPGDWLCPLGMQGKRKKISDFLVDVKVPRSLKGQVYVVESEGNIAWLVGFRGDERFKVNEKTTKILKFTKT
ncbi:tRNA lysidine(34) synthetase TilS [Runella slithyformis]|uniref:tRNA(Ile)-lysidine synthase n=1 Tax=Runella slithyformis (strain ATCC 29530 / DSM 19594 / LMG 11500 / NCIMB 11436 / LSU 4) TaxID=761193 RepID=A0A7U3ZNU7_RUNSL|nr:tRNA lysidine(34) synthetase TilS [Runella slithyformis]AEI50640.1 tRNA(Ile)-lysidine synthase [Runella slithyformis DSM 19594]